MALTPALAKRAERAAKLKLARIAKTAREDIALIKRRKGEIEEAFYDIGEALRRLRPIEVVRAVGCNTFAELCETKLGISVAQADRLITIVERMNRNDVRGLGASKAAALIDLVDATPARDTAAGALARGVTLPDGQKLLPRRASARAIERAAKDVRQAHPPKGKRGKRIDPADRAVGDALEASLHALGAKDAKVTVVAGQPGRGARLRIEGLEVARLETLKKAIANVHRRR